MPTVLLGQSELDERASRSDLPARYMLIHMPPAMQAMHASKPLAQPDRRSSRRCMSSSASSAQMKKPPLPPPSVDICRGAELGSYRWSEWPVPPGQGGAAGQRDHMTNRSAIHAFDNRLGVVGNQDPGAVGIQDTSHPRRLSSERRGLQSPMSFADQGFQCSITCCIPNAWVLQWWVAHSCPKDGEGRERGTMPITNAMNIGIRRFEYSRVL